MSSELIDIARNSIKSNFSQEEYIVEDSLKEKFKDNKGVFVTLELSGELRGCIGFIQPIYPLWEAVMNAAKAAAFEDPRFSPLTEEEFAGIKIKISILSKPELIECDPVELPNSFEVGKHGLIIKSGPYSGLLLPQVFVDHKVDSVGALEMTCMKAGLAKECWKEGSAKIYKFSAELVSEKR